MHMDENDDVVIETDGSEELGGKGGDAGAKVSKLKAELEQVKKEKQEYLDGWQRSKADYVNALKRFDAERILAVTIGQTKALATLLPAYDALERAKEHGELPEGFAGIAKQLESGFAALGVTSFGAVGDAFDPNQHEALGMDSTDDKSKDDVITAVLEKGYKSGENVLRPAKVRVAHFEG